MTAARFARAYAGAIFGSRTSIGRRRRRPSGEVRPTGGSGVVPVEELKCRQLLSVSYNLSSGVLTATGDGNSQTIHVFRSTGVGVDDINIRETIGGASSDSQWYSTSSITQITILGQGGNDTIIIETDGSHPIGTEGVDTPTNVDGGVGDDTVWGGDGPDTANGNDGYDVLHGRNGADTLRGGADCDEVYGYAGNDTIEGGTDGDFLQGGDGNDIVYGGTPGDSDGASDTLYGDAGTDSVYGGGGNDIFHSDDGEADYLDGGDGSDTATDRDGSDTLFNMEYV